MLEALTSSRLLRSSPWLARLALAAAFVFCAWQAVHWGLLTLAGPDLPAASPVTTMPAQQAPLARGQIAKWHLFGNAQGGTDLAALAQAKMRETELRLTLRGTFNESRPEGGIAIIADEQGNDRAYRVGEVLPGDARLEQILAGVVVLSRGGVNETLSLRLTEENTAAAPARRSAPARAPLPGSGVVPQGGFAINPNIAVGMPDMQTYRATQLPNVQELAKQVQVTPAFVNGRMRGVRINVGRDSDLLEKAGLKPNDIVTAVNGIPLDSPTRQGQLLSSLRDAKQVQIDVERDGQTLKLQLGL